MTTYLAAPCPAPDDQRLQDTALEASFAAHAAALRRRLTAMTRDPAVADDLVSEAFVRLALEIRAGRHPRDTRAWLYRVSANLATSRARHRAVVLKANPRLVDRDLAASPEDEFVRAERGRELRGGLGTLSEADRSIVILAARGFRPAEIAAIIGCSNAATRTRLCRARGRLKQHLLQMSAIA